MAADLGLVVHAAQADARELAAHGAGDRLAERGLADAGRSDEAQDRRLAFGRQLAHGQVLDDALLDLLQAEMVVRRARGGPRRCRSAAPRAAPRAARSASRDRCGSCRARPPPRACARSRRSSLRASALDLRRHLRLGDRLVEVGDLLLARIVLAQLALDRRHLLAQQHLALARVERGLGLLADLAATAAALRAAWPAAARPCRDAARDRSPPGSPASPPAWNRDRSRRGRPARRPTLVFSTVWRSSCGTCGSSSSASRICCCRTRKRASISGPVVGRLDQVQAARHQERDGPRRSR